MKTHSAALESKVDLAKLAGGRLISITVNNCIPSKPAMPNGQMEDNIPV